MPIWTEEEIKIGASKLPINSRHISKVDQLYTKYGGIPLYYFSSISSLDDDLDREIAKVTLSSIKCLDVEIDLHETHLIFHRYSADDGSNRIIMKFASGEIAGRVLKRLEKNEKAHLTTFLEYSSEDSDLSILRGQLFEEKMHVYIPGGGKFDVWQPYEKSKTACEKLFENMEVGFFRRVTLLVKWEYTVDL